MPAPQSDAFVFFGATGDLAYKQIFPALQVLIRRGQLDCCPPSTSASGAAAWRRSPLRTPRDEVVEVIAQTIERVRWREAQQGIALIPEWSPPEHRFVRAWCAHGSLSETVEAYAAPAGDGLQLLGQTIDLLQQGAWALRAIGRAGAARVGILRRALRALSHDGKLERLLGL